MLTVYTYKIDKPANSIDLSTSLLSELTDSALAILSHQKTCHIWLGYLEGWMLTPHEEVLLRNVLRKFQCTVVSHVPVSFSVAWQNEIDIIYTVQPNGHSYSDHNGGSLHDGCEA